jgi:exonuclease VII small subunit
VPGHGDLGGKAFLDAQMASLTQLVDLARRVETGELTLDEAIAAHPFPEHPPEDARRGFERALSQLRGELDRVVADA